MADIATELATIHDDPKGRNVKLAIYSALDKINRDIESIDPSSGEWPVGHMSVDFLNGYIAPYRLGFMGENPNPEYIEVAGTRLMPLRDCWCVVEQTIRSDTEDSSLETGSISDTGSHAWTNVANYRLDGSSGGYVYRHLWITRLLAGEIITLSGDRTYDGWDSFLIQNGAQQGDFDEIDADVIASLPYVGPSSSDYTTRVYYVSQAMGHLGGADFGIVKPETDIQGLFRVPEYGSTKQHILFVQTDNMNQVPTFVEDDTSSSGTKIPFYENCCAIITFALR